MKSSILVLLTIAALCSCTNSTSTSGSETVNPVLLDKNYPSAHPVEGDRNKVISPYRPYNIISVKGLKPGHLARDISTAKKDANGKPIESTAKIFRIPTL